MAVQYKGQRVHRFGLLCRVYESGNYASREMASALKLYFTLWMLTSDSEFLKIISDSRPCEFVDTLLSMQNKDGGFNSYKRSRGSAWLELLSRAKVIDCIMIEYSYPGCTISIPTFFFPHKLSKPHICRNQVCNFLRGQIHPREPALGRRLVWLVGNLLHLRYLVRVGEPSKWAIRRPRRAFTRIACAIGLFRS